MKFRTTQKYIKENNWAVIRVGYCNLCYLLQYEYPMAYTTRVEGWASDVYVFNGVAISTGYAPFGKVKPDYTIQRRYNEAARGKTKEECRGLIDQFIKEVCGE